jgi:uncharacterized protein GlcG (DUF336 family)
MKLFRMAAMCVAAVGLSASAFGQSLPATKVLTFEAAHTMAQAAMAHCRAEGHQVSVLVVDPLNEPIVLLRDDGSVPANLEYAKLKATTAILFRNPSAAAYPTAEQSPQSPVLLPGTLNRGGSVPIKVGDSVIGVIAVAGAGGGDKDAACANAGIAKIVDLLK